MADRPLLILPTPQHIKPPRGRGGGGDIHFPTRDTQVRQFEPVFQRLRHLLDGDGADGVELHDDPISLAPERVIVFEIAGTVSNFVNAVARVPGLEFMLEYETEEAPDERFAVQDKREGRTGQIRDDKTIPGRFYLTMPDIKALRQLISLWERWSRGESLGTGYTPFKHVFSQLRALRPWGAEDRILDETIEYWREKLETSPDRAVRTEVELWYYQSKQKRRESLERFDTHVREAGGQIIQEAVIAEISYHGVLIDIPAQAIQSLVERSNVHLALADEVMFLRPQSVLVNELEPEEISEPDLDGQASDPLQAEPIAALFDGFPVQSHELLTGRLRVDDPDDLEAMAVVSRRIHGTAMASLILHGDLNTGESALERPLYIRPIMFAPENESERTSGERLLVDTIYRAVVRMKGRESEEATAPTVFLVNLSIGDRRRPFARTVSPLARLLDFLAEHYGILFLVSGGNMPYPIQLNQFDTWADFEATGPEERERAVLKALNATKHQRTILSPGESLNALTIGAQHHDEINSRPSVPMTIDPYDDNTLPNASSALGLGYRRAIKPEIYLPGGREYLRMGRSGGGIEARFQQPQRLFGLNAAAPDSSGQGRLDRTALSDGTSSATALATRSAHRIFDALMDREGGSLLADMPPEFYAVVVKALLVHRSRWNGKSELLKEICGPYNGRRFVEQSENISRFVGFGMPNMMEAMECSSNRVTLVGYGKLDPDQAHGYRIPLPGSLEHFTDPRALTVTVAWFSPIKPGHQSYRCARLEAAADQPRVALGVERFKAQPADALVKKGTLFHERYEGRRAVPFINDGHLSMTIWCKEDAGGVADAIRYGVAVTLESEAAIGIYEEVRARLQITPRV